MAMGHWRVKSNIIEVGGALCWLKIVIIEKSAETKIFLETSNSKNYSFLWWAVQYQKWSPTVGLEPTTTRLRALRSTDWARRADILLFFLISPVRDFEFF